MTLARLEKMVDMSRCSTSLKESKNSGRFLVLDFISSAIKTIHSWLYIPIGKTYFSFHFAGLFFRNWMALPMLPKPMRNHGCGASTTTNETFLVVFGGISGASGYPNHFMVLNMGNLKQGWYTFQYGSIPYSGHIYKSFVLQLDEKRCELMFVGFDGLYICKKNFIWTKKPFTILPGAKFTWSGIGRLQHCWTTNQKNIG